MSRHEDPAAPARFFEGTEKKVELLIDPALPSLRRLGDEFWGRIVARCRARVLSKLSNAVCDAYLLSESSLFVYDHKMVMITCGRTRLPDSVLELLDTVPLDGIELFIYERKNEVYPHRQPTSFDDDARLLHARLPGRALRFGDEDEHHLMLFHLARPFAGVPRDLTVELLMYGLDPAARRQFDRATAGDPASLRSRTGLEAVLAGCRIDDHLFEPSGYSLNAIRDDAYWTIHVTPQEISSYASFETNCRLDAESLRSTAERILEVFRPRSFDLVLFHRDEPVLVDLPDYRLRAHVAARLEIGYGVQFRSYYRPESGARRPVELPVI